MAERTVKKTTTIRTSHVTGDDDLGYSSFRSGISPRRSTVREASLRESPVLQRTTAYSSRMFASSAQGEGQVVTAPADVIAHRQKEKQDLGDLNERFATYIERVRFLEKQNIKLRDDVTDFRTKLEGLSANIKATFETELQEARRLIDDTAHDKAKVEARSARLQEELDEYKKSFDALSRQRAVEKDRLMKLELQLSDKDAEVDQLSSKFDSLSDDLGHYKKEIAQLTTDLPNLRSSNEEEMLLRVEKENNLQSLQEELDFQNQLQQTTVKELLDQLTRGEEDEDMKHLIK
ncbi:PREDICTED: intermediate filament protein ifa-2-like, partial [Priapulus caudatus]|uniref:Intermediate filament protein ifa-2-like n=1 Tax=Priapulus caudatus TaxID=37621 RepID=A0ABM1F3V9_PRICU